MINWEKEIENNSVATDEGLSPKKKPWERVEVE